MPEAQPLNNHDSECVVSVCDLSKKYCRSLRRSLRYGLQDIANEVLPRQPRRTASLREGEFWALENVSFEVARGESLAIIGANGSGKSTLLKVLYGLVKPDGGEARLRGRIGALIELGTGFNPLLSGRENIHVNAAVFGFTRKQTEPLMDSIIDFAAISDFIDTPLQYYSSGMRTRLAYAVAAHLQPDVLLVDEVLAVGDIAFQRKCVVHMQQYLAKGGSLLFVSHSPYHVQAICQRGVLLEQGRLTYSGSAIETLDRYFQIQHQKTAVSATARTTPVLDAEHPVVIENVSLKPANGEEIWTGEEVRFSIHYQALESQSVYWGFGVWSSDGWICVTGDYTSEKWKLEAGQGELRCVIPRLPLVGGSYLLKAVIIDASTNQPLALYGWQDAPLAFSVRTPAGVLSNNLKALNQLVTLDVEWL